MWQYTTAGKVDGIDGEVDLNICFTGIAVGAVELLTSIRQGQVCANGASAMGNGHDVFNNTLILAVFPELYAILSLLVLILITGMI